MRLRDIKLYNITQQGVDGTRFYYMKSNSETGFHSLSHIAPRKYIIVIIMVAGIYIGITVFKTLF
jgi:hypothetical protein